MQHSLRKKQIPEKEAGRICTLLLSKVLESLLLTVDSKVNLKHIPLEVALSLVVSRWLELHTGVSQKNNDALHKIIAFLSMEDVPSELSIDVDQVVFENKDIFLHSAGYLIDWLYQNYLGSYWIYEEGKIVERRADDKRKDRGAYFTPYEIALRIVQKTIDSDFLKEKDLKVLDPACGAGVFLSATLHHVVSLGIKPKDAVEEIIYGFDIEPLATRITQLLLQLEAGYKVESITVSDNVKCEDFLFLSCQQLSNGQGVLGFDNSYMPNFSAIVMNPPYDRLKPDGRNKEEKKRVAEYVARVKGSGMFSLSCNGSLELYRLFIEKAMSVLSEDGRLGAIVPRSFLADKSALGLRKDFLLKGYFRDVEIIPEKSRLFEGVSQAFTIFTLDKKQGKEIAIKVADFDGAAVVSSTHISPSKLVSFFPKTAVISRVCDKGQLVLEHLSNCPSIGDVDFVQNLRGELDLTLDKKFVNEGSMPMLRGKAVGQYTYSVSETADWEGFSTAKVGSKKIGYVHSMRLAGQQVSNMDSAKRLKYCLVKEPAILANSLNFLAVDGGDIPSGFDLYALLGYINSLLLDWRFRIGSSNNHVNNYEVDELPLPVCSDDLHYSVSQHVKKLLKNPDNVCVRRELEEAVLKSYGVHEFREFLKKEHALGEAIFG